MKPEEWRDEEVVLTVDLAWCSHGILDLKLERDLRVSQSSDFTPMISARFTRDSLEHRDSLGNSNMP